MNFDEAKVKVSRGIRDDMVAKKLREIERLQGEVRDLEGYDDQEVVIRLFSFWEEARADGAYVSRAGYIGDKMDAAQVMANLMGRPFSFVFNEHVRVVSPSD